METKISSRKEEIGNKGGTQEMWRCRRKC